MFFGLKRTLTYFQGKLKRNLSAYYSSGVPSGMNSPSQLNSKTTIKNRPSISGLTLEETNTSTGGFQILKPDYILSLIRNQITLKNKIFITQVRKLVPHQNR